MTKQYLLDTTACVSLLRGNRGLAEKIARVGRKNCYVSDITLAELYFGAHKSGRQQHFEDIDKVKALFTVLASNVCYDEYGYNRWSLEKDGNKIADFDLLIASTAIHYNMTVVTANVKHFARIKLLDIENW